MRGTGTGLGVCPHFNGRSSPRRSGRRNLGVLGWAVSGRLWRERGAGGGEARFERDAAERPPPDLSARAAGRGARPARQVHPRSPVCTAVGAQAVSCRETWVPGGKAACGTRGVQRSAGERRRRPTGRSRSRSRSRPRARRTDASSWVILSLLSRRSPLSLEGGRGVGVKGRTGLRACDFLAARS